MGLPVLGLTLPQFNERPGLALEASRDAWTMGFGGVFVFDHLWPLGQPQRPALEGWTLLAALAARAGGPVTGEVVFAAATEGDKAALGLFERIGHWLGIGIASLVTIFDPELVVVGGGVAATGELLLAPARASFERYVHARAHRDLPPVVPARLGPDAGLVGAATLALARG